jgi:hypothetical protein
MSEESNAAGGGIGFCGLLAIAFIVLKLCGVIDWSWWWVLAPLWIPPGLVISAALMLGVMMFIHACLVLLIEKAFRRKRS